MNLTLHRSVAISLALAAMLLRALMPDGWMPVAAAFTICSIDAGRHDNKAPADQERGHSPCAFAAAAPLAAPAAVTVTLGTVSQPLRLSASYATLPSASAVRHRPNAARAPPAFA